MHCGICNEEIYPTQLSSPQVLFEMDLDPNPAECYYRSIVFSCCGFSWLEDITKSKAVPVGPAFDEDGKLKNSSLLNYIKSQMYILESLYELSTSHRR